MVEAILIIVAILAVLGMIAAGRSVRVVQQFEQGIVFRFGRIQSPPRGAGLTMIRPVGDRMQKVNMQIIAMAVPAQDGITRDNVTVRVDAVVYLRVVDPIKATVNVQNYLFAVSQQAETSLRSIIGQSEMDQLRARRTAWIVPMAAAKLRSLIVARPTWPAVFRKLLTAGEQPGLGLLDPVIGFHSLLPSPCAASHPARTASSMGRCRALMITSAAAAGAWTGPIRSAQLNQYQSPVAPPGAAMTSLHCARSCGSCTDRAVSRPAGMVM